MPGLAIIGYDGSEAADHAIAEAARVLGPRPALVVVAWEDSVAYESFSLPAIPVAPIDFGASAETDEALFQGARHTAAHGAETARAAGFDAEGLAVTGDHSVSSALVRLARERDAEVVVVGARGLNAVQRMLIGSTSREVVEHAPCPVLVVRPPAD